MASSPRTEGTVAATAAAPATAGPEAQHEGLSGSHSERRRQPEQLPGPMASATALEARTISCLTNAHYHSSREAYLDTVHRWFMFSVIALGAAALTDVLPRMLHALFGWAVDVGVVKEVCAAGAAILAALDLTFDLSNRARAHAMMKRRYFELLAALREGKKTPEQVGVCLDEFSADEEPPYRILYFASWNSAQMTVFGRRAKRFKLSALDNLFKNWWRRPSANYEPVGPDQMS
jgi:hypothetical protein